MVANGFGVDRASELQSSVFLRVVLDSAGFCVLFY